MRDLEADNLMDRVLIMTYSEFGRRIHENGSRGTDHGSAAPLFVLGGNMNGGIYGDLPDLVNLDETDNIPYQIDFRSVYAGVMERWFEMAPETVAEVLGGPFEAVPVCRRTLHRCHAYGRTSGGLCPGPELSQPFQSVDSDLLHPWPGLRNPASRV